jgi:hypothetical protein
VTTRAIPDPEETPFLPLWPDIGRILGISRSSSYRSADSGEIPTCRFGARLVVPVAWLRRTARLDEAPTESS